MRRNKVMKKLPINKQKGDLKTSDIDFISYLKTLKPEDWKRRVNNKWTVKDVVAHMVGWERGDPEAIYKAWKTKKPPWWMETDDYDDFNRENVENYKNYTPEQLINEWERWQNFLQREMDKVGEENLRSRPDLFGWLFEEGEGSHYEHHFKQIREVVEKHQEG